MATNVEKDVETLKAELGELKSDITKLTDSLKQLYGDSAEEGRQRFREATARSRERARETMGAVESEIEERPFTSIAAAFGVGFILGKLLDR